MMGKSKYTNNWYRTWLYTFSQSIQNRIIYVSKFDSMLQESLWEIALDGAISRNSIEYKSSGSNIFVTLEGITDQWEVVIIDSSTGTIDFSKRFNLQSWIKASVGDQNQFMFISGVQNGFVVLMRLKIISEWPNNDSCQHSKIVDLTIDKTVSLFCSEVLGLKTIGSPQIGFKTMIVSTDFSTQTYYHFSFIDTMATEDLYLLGSK